METYNNKFYKEEEVKQIALQLAEEFKGTINTDYTNIVCIDVLIKDSLEGFGFAFTKIKEVYPQNQMKEYGEDYVLCWNPWIYNKTHCTLAENMLNKVLRKYPKCEVIVNDDPTSFNCSVDRKLIEEVNKSEKHSYMYIDSDSIENLRTLLKNMKDEYDEV